MSADATFEAITAGNWNAASEGVGKLDAAWTRYRSRQVPPRIAADMTSAVAALDKAVEARSQVRAGTAAIDVAQSGLELQLRHRPQAEIDRARFELWARQLLVDATARDLGGIRGDLATLEWIRDRFAVTIDKVDLTRIDAQLVGLRGALNNGDLRGISTRAARLRATLCCRVGLRGPRARYVPARA